MQQSSNKVIVVRPHHFSSNPETMADNSFQSVEHGRTDIAKRAHQESTEVIAALRKVGVDVDVFEDQGKETPDSVFPNNWFSTHSSGQLVLYPMYSSNRRRERRQDIIHWLQQQYGYLEVVDLTAHEQRDCFLEGTGSIVFDHTSRLAYASRSRRMNELVLKELCQRLGYQPIVFDATTSAGSPIYHTNVMMAVGAEFVMASPELIRDPQQQQYFLDTIASSGKTLIALTEHQVVNFAGNTLELAAGKQQLLAISTRALAALTESQRQQLEQWVTLLPLAIPTIELGGGSIRCMLAQVFTHND